jgi:ubiquinone/menaquinone biosynthesis C-methylase UbiE
MGALVHGLIRRWRRQRRRRTVGRAYDMALEIANIIPKGATVLDVGCGNGFIAHHLTCMLRASVVGIDVSQTTEARIPYLRYDGRHLPVRDQTFDVVLLCYVLHHAQNCSLVLAEIRRVMKTAGLVVVYEDMPSGGWNQAVCWVHDRKWRERSGPCTFRLASGWRRLFHAEGFQVIYERQLSRWRNLAHPVSRKLFILELSETDPQITQITEIKEREDLYPILVPQPDHL